MLATRMRGGVDGTLDDVWTSVGNRNLIGGDMQAGYFGVVSTDDFITGDALATLVGLDSIGTSQFSTEGWLKLAYQDKIQFVPKKPIRYGVSWDQMLDKGVVWGDRTTSGYKTVNIDGLTYKVRLLRGLNSSYNPKEVPSGYLNEHCYGSEWNLLILPLHIGAKTGSWGNSESNVEPDLPYWGVDFTDSDLHVASGDGRGTLTQNYSSSRNYRVVRGNNGAANVLDRLSSAAIDSLGWRPVLELVV